MTAQPSMRRRTLSAYLTLEAWQRIEALGEPNIRGDCDHERFNCIIVAAMITVELRDQKFSELDRAHLERHRAVERELADAFKDLGKARRERGLY